MSILNHAISFYHTRKAWLGDDGKPVPPDVAQKRANTCLMGNEGKKCPHNQEMPLFEILTSAVAASVIRQLKVKNELGLKLRGEESLFTCAVCMCSNRLKPWTPSRFIHISFKQEELPPWCWMHELFDKQQNQNSHDNKIDGLPK